MFDSVHVSVCSRLFMLVRILLSFAVLGSFGVQLYVPVNIIWPAVESNITLYYPAVSIKYAQKTFILALILLACEYKTSGVIMR